MSSTALAAPSATMPDAQTLEKVLIGGDLKDLTPPQRVAYYRSVCESVGLNPLTKPFEYITLNGKLTLYAKRDATDQLRQLKGVSITKLEPQLVEGIYIVVAHAVDKTGRQDSATGAVVVEGLKGEAKANALMKAETKAKRRVTLSICGLGWTDESEIDSIPTARPVTVDTTTGEIVEPSKTPHRTVLKVTEETQTDEKTGAVLRAFRLTLDGDQDVWTPDALIAEQAGEAAHDETPVQIDVKQSPKTGKYVVTKFQRIATGDNPF